MTEPTPLTQEAEIAKDALTRILAEMEFPATVEATETADQVSLAIASEQPLGVLIGKNGQTLNAIELVLKQIVQHKTKSYGKHLQVDAEGYRERHAEHLREVARDVADRVREHNEAIELEPMNARDRRTIHMVIQEMGDLATYSAGEDPYRHIVICPPGMEPEGARE
jgi:spoIIIJ-associated protein